MHLYKKFSLTVILVLLVPAMSFGIGGKDKKPGEEKEAPTVKKERKSLFDISVIGVQAGMKSGLTYTTISTSDPTNATLSYGRGLTTSGFIIFTSETGTELNIGAGYLNQTAIIGIQDSVSQDWILNFDYFSLPIVLHYPFYYDVLSNNREVSLFTLVGLEFNSAIRAHRDLTQEEEGFVITDNLSSRIHRFEAGLTGGAGLSFGITPTVNLVMDGRAFFGLTNFNKNIPLIDYTLNMLHTRFQVSTGLAVKL